jgi:hypothetical protein
VIPSRTQIIASAMAVVVGSILGALVLSCSDDHPSARTIEVRPPVCLSPAPYPATTPEPYPAEGSRVVAALGARLDYGPIMLVIPPGALAADTEIHLHSNRPGEDFPGQDPLDNELRYGFDPRDLTFAVPGTLTIKPFFNISAGMHPVIAQTDSLGSWHDLETRWDAGRGTVTVATLSGFVPRRVKLSTNNCSFEPCGGDIEGEWFHNTACGGPWKFPSGSTSCAKSFYRVQPLIQGSLTFSAGTFSSKRDCSKPWNAQIPFICVDRAACGAQTSSTGKCTVSSFCSCEGNLDQEFRTRKGTFTTSGTTMTLVDESSDSQLFSYCAQGDSLVLEGGDGRVFELVRSKR